MRTAADPSAVWILHAAPPRGIKAASWLQQPSAQPRNHAQPLATASFRMQPLAAVIHRAATASAPRTQSAAKASGTARALALHGPCARSPPKAVGPAHARADALRCMTIPDAMMARAAPSCAISARRAVTQTGTTPVFPSRANTAAAPLAAARAATSPA